MNQFITYRASLKNNITERLTISKSKSKVEDPNAVVWWEMALMFFLLAINGNPYLAAESDAFTVLSAIIPIVHILRNYNKSISYRTIFIFVFFLGFELLHAVVYKLDYSLTFFKLTLILLLSAAIVDILKDKFIVVLTKTMVLICLVSFVFVFISYTPIHTLLYKLGLKLFPVPEYNNIIPSTIIIFTFSWEYYKGILPYVRNCGIFWESGGFAVFLNVTLFLHYSSRSIKTVRDLFDKDSAILIFALVTSTSTMGMLSLITVLAFFSAQLKSALKYILIILIFIATYLAFTAVDFLGDKIDKQLNESGVSNNRFGSALKDWENISERPLLGWSRRIEVVFGTSIRSAKTHRPNGFTNFIRSYGFIYFSLYFFFVFTSFKNVCSYHNLTYNYYTPLFGVFLLWLVSFSELIFEFAFFKSLMFLYFAYYPSKVIQKQQAIKKPISN